MRAALCASAWRTPLGNDIASVMQRLFAGERAVSAHPLFDASQYQCRVAAAIPGDPPQPRRRRYLRRIGLHAVEVAMQVMQQSGVDGGERLGLFFGYGGLRAHWAEMMSAFQGQQDDAADGWARGLHRLHPFWMLQHLSNNAHALTAEELQAKGEGATFGGANAGAQALGAAVRALTAGAVDHALVVAHDSLLEPETLVEMSARGALTAAAAERVIAPYAAAPDGAVPAEAVVAVLLRCEAGDRDTWLEVADGADGDRGHPSAAALQRVVAPLVQGGEAVDGCGLALTTFDAAERELLASMLGADAALFCSLAAMGQVGAAAPLLQAIVLDAALRQGRLPPVAGLQRAAAGPLRVLTEATAWAGSAAIGLSVGAPGLLAAIRVQRV